MGDLTIDQLAQQTGFTVRNVRSHQTRGLLPGPEMRGRVGYYGEEHVERLRLIQQLQDDGLPLRLMERLLVTRPDTADRLLALRRTVVSSMQEPAEEQRLTARELAERFGSSPEALRRAVELGVLVPQDDATFTVAIPALLEVADTMVGRGIPVERAVDVALEVHRLCQDAATVFVDMVVDEVWKPFQDAGHPSEQFPQIVGTIDEIRPLAGDTFLALLPSAIAAETDRAFGARLREQAEAGAAE